MHCYEWVKRNAEAVFIAKITIGNSCENEAPLFLEGDVQPLEFEELDPYCLKLPLFHGHILNVPKLVMSTRSGGGELPHTTEGAVAYEL